MAQAKITKRTVVAAKPDGRNLFIWDTDLRGFGLKVTPAGTKSYLIQYRTGGRESPTRRFTIGRHGSPWTPDKARGEAERLLMLVRQGKDPMAHERERRRVAVDLAFHKYADLFIERYAKRNKSWPETKRIIDRDLKPPLRGRPLPEITRAEITRLLDNIAHRAPGAARLAHAHLRKLFKWAVDRGDLALSPMADMSPPASAVSRDRVLTDAELNAVWHSCDDLGWPFGDIVRLLIATGQRRSEVAAMDWSEIDMEAALWVVPASRTKNAKEHRVPLNAPAIAILEAIKTDDRKRGLVFSTTGETPPSGFSRAKRRLDGLVLERLRQDAVENDDDPDAATLPPWRIHDLRRTLATGLQRLGVRLEVTEAVLGHVSGSRAGIVGVYQRYDWAEEKRAALDAWAAHLGRLCAPQDKVNVVPFNREGTA